MRNMYPDADYFAFLDDMRENGEMNTPLSRMGYVMSECTTFTTKYVSKMLRLLFGAKNENE